MTKVAFFYTISVMYMEHDWCTIGGRYHQLRRQGELGVGIRLFVEIPHRHNQPEYNDFSFQTGVDNFL